jgi:hypothetical protein
MNLEAFDRPTVPSLFRKCQVCRLYGHYEIECKKMTEEDAIELAHHTMVSANVRELLSKRRNKRDLTFRHVEFEQKTLEDGLQTDEPEEGDFARKYLVCDVCHSGLDDDHMLICDGCDKLFHLYCLTPRLKRVPKGDWFCKTCVEYNQDVSSDVEIEACEGFVIEQQKRPRQEASSKGEHEVRLPPNEWQMAVTVIREGLYGSIDSSATYAKRRRAPVVNNEETVIDGFVVHAQSTSDSPHVSKRMKSWAHSVEDVSRDVLVPGSIVAWFPSDGSSSKVSSPSVGHVLAVDAHSRKALVRRIVEWKDVLRDHRSDETVSPPSSLEECAIRALPSGPTLWYPADDLHIVARSASKSVAKQFRKEILPSRIRGEQTRPAALTLM